MAHTANPRMLDFGIAHALDGTSVTRTGMMTGTPGWISPEHYRDSDMVADLGAQLHAAAEGPLDTLRVRTRPEDCTPGPTSPPAPVGGQGTRSGPSVYTGLPCLQLEPEVDEV